MLAQPPPGFPQAEYARASGTGARGVRLFDRGANKLTAARSPHVNAARLAPLSAYAFLFAGARREQDVALTKN